MRGLRLSAACLVLSSLFLPRAWATDVQAQYESAIDLWQQALRLTPGDAKLKDCIAQTKKKMAALKQLAQ